MPVSISYDKIIEGVYYEELMGLPKKRESIWRVIQAFFSIFSIRNKCGDAVIDIGEPVSLNVILNYFLNLFF